MSLNYVNQKTIDGVIYTAYRDSDNPRITMVTAVTSPSKVKKHPDLSEGKKPKDKLNKIWNNEAEIKALFKKEKD